jgi:twitching motility protein PilT
LGVSDLRADTLPQQQAVVAKLLSGVVNLRASDVHLRANSAPFVRVDGALSKTTAAPLSPQLVEDIIQITSGRSLSGGGTHSWEYSFEQPGLARFRGHVFRENDRWALALRVVPLAIPSFAELRLPPVVKVLAETAPGLVLICGPTGSGKSTTAASVLYYLASHETVHLVTVEDPIEYRLVDLASCISQREVGRDTASFEEALRSVLREDPDALFISEIRDLPTLEVALQAAETGHAVLSTFHTSTALKAVQRMVAMFAPEDQPSARARLGDSLKGLIAQRLLPRKGGRGRVLCTEVMINNYAAKECIRDPARTSALTAVLERSGEQQMHSFDQCLAVLVRESLVAPEVALAYANAPADFKRALNFPGLVP